jgi:hypothetical protein
MSKQKISPVYGDKNVLKSDKKRKDKSKSAPCLNIVDQIVPNFRPENIRSFFPVPTGRPSPLNLTIETPPGFSQSSFTMLLPPLYTHISHISLVSYTVIIPVLDSNGISVSAGFNLVFCLYFVFKISCLFSSAS